MELVLNIFKQLGADSTFFIQLVIFVIAFIVLKFVLFEKIKKVIENREEKTTGLAQKAKEKEEEIIVIEDKYQREIDATQALAQNEYQGDKIKILESQRSVIKKAEENSAAEIEKEKTGYQKELDKMSGALLGSSSDIADQLVEKFTK